MQLFIRGKHSKKFFVVQLRRNELYIVFVDHAYKHSRYITRLKEFGGRRPLVPQLTEQVRGKEIEGRSAHFRVKRTQISRHGEEQNADNITAPMTYAAVRNFYRCLTDVPWTYSAFVERA